MWFNDKVLLTIPLRKKDSLALKELKYTHSYNLINKDYHFVISYYVRIFDILLSMQLLIFVKISYRKSTCVCVWSWFNKALTSDRELFMSDLCTALLTYLLTQWMEYFHIVNWIEQVESKRNNRGGWGLDISLFL